jgi:hypothetical protein
MSKTIKKERVIPFQIDLVDGVKLNQKHPNTFHIPSDEEKSELCVGNIVKVIDEKYRERFWVEIDDFITDDLMIGIIRNDLVGNQPYTFNDKIFMKMEHIIMIEHLKSEKGRGLFSEERNEN